MKNSTIKEYRDLAGLTQAQLASIAGIPQSTIHRYENDSMNVPLKELLRILIALGVDSAQFLHRHAADLPMPIIDPGTPYSSIDNNLRRLGDYIDARPPFDMSFGMPTIKNLEALAGQIGRRPNVVLVGPYDAGKSTFANTLLGQGFLPTAYQPTTKVTTFIQHVDRRPCWIKEEVWMMSSEFNILEHQDQEHCEKCRVVSGNQETLRDFGTADAKHYSPDIQFALVFLRAPVLCTCNIVDLPGFDNNASDSEMAKNNPLQTDVLVYVNPIMGFMKSADILRLGQYMSVLPPLRSSDTNIPPLGNLFVVASHAHRHIAEAELDTAIDKAARRSFQILNAAEMIKKEYPDIDEKKFRERFFSFSREEHDRQKAIINDLSLLLGKRLPQIWNANAAKEILDFRDSTSNLLTKALDRLNKVQHDKDERKTRYHRLIADESEFKKRRLELRKSTKEKIASYQSEAVKAAEQICNDYLTPDRIEKIIHEHYPDKKEAQQAVAAFLQQIIQGAIAQDNQKRTEALAAELQAYFKSLNREWDRINEGIVLAIPFNATGAFLGGLVGTGAVGALAAWASSLGPLGSYIIAAKMTSLLATVGISFSGGTATVISFMASIGGPMTIAIAIVIVGVLTGLTLIGSWQSRLADNTAKAFAKNKYKERSLQGVQKFWEDTTTAFDKGADDIEKQWEDYLKEMRALDSEKSSEGDSIPKQIERLQAARNFFGGLPWKA